MFNVVKIVYDLDIENNVLLCILILPFDPFAVTKESKKKFDCIFEFLSKLK